MGAFIAWVYQKFGTKELGGNNLLIDSVHQPQNAILRVRIAPLVYLGTIFTHLVGGSAGREGTALQMGGGIVRLVKNWFKAWTLSIDDLVIIAMSASFGAVFGTPFAGIIFGMECTKSFKKHLIFPIVFTSFLAHWTTDLCAVHHTHYPVNHLFEWNFLNGMSLIFASILFGLAAWLFAILNSKIGIYWKRGFKNPIWAAAVGGMVLLIVFQLFGLEEFQGLGVPYIQQAFLSNAPNEAFLLKLLLTTFTLSVGFKGGEVTPLFFIGATLGSALATYLPISNDVLAAVGFVAVFGAATNTPIASTIMGIELFGVTLGFPLGIGCVIAYFISGNHSIYKQQLFYWNKFSFLNKG